MPAKLQKLLPALVALVLLAGVFFLERDLNHDRDRLGLSRYPELKGAPPMLALTTVALGGFRGLISNALWIRMSDLQDEGKYFEMVQLADWITKLEPNFSQVWANQAWNMAYNISVKFKDPPDRWRWVQRGIELLRDEGLKYNEHDILLHRELAWIFQHKMAGSADDARYYYLEMWNQKMTNIFGPANADFEKLIHPRTAEETNRVRMLRETYKMDPVTMKRVDEKYGPLEWRLPEAHAIYWADQGLEDAKLNLRKVDTNDFILLRRVIYQSMQLSMQQGRLVHNPVDPRFGGFEPTPNLAIIGKANQAYEQAIEEDAKMRDHIQIAHRNFLADAVFFLYTYGREADAAAWYKYLAEHYPNKPLLEGRPTSYTSTLSLDDYAMGRIQAGVTDTRPAQTQWLLGGLVAKSYQQLAIGEDERYVGLQHLAEQIWNAYHAKLKDASLIRMGLPPMSAIRNDELKKLVRPGVLTPEMLAVLKTRLGTLPEPDVIPTNAPSATISTSSTNTAALTGVTNNASAPPK